MENYSNSPKFSAYHAFENEIVHRCEVVATFNFYDGENYNDIFNYFHANDVTSLHFPDDRHFDGIRANTFVVEIGWHEWYEGEAFMVSANHKGTREMKLFIQK